MSVSSDIPPVLSVGRLYCDLIFTGLPRLPSLGTEVFTEGFGTHAGGGAFITAAHLAALGHPSSLATMLPSSPFSDLMRSELEASRVDLTLSGTLPESAGPQVTVAMVEAGDRAFLTRRAGPAFPAIAPRELARRGVKHLHVGELASLVAQPEIIQVARAQNMTISVDCSWDEAVDTDALGTLTGLIDVFLPNEAEWAFMAELGLAEAFAPLTVIKRGAKGASAISKSGTLDAPTNPVDAVDTTGAGDAFNAGFLSRWLMGDTIEACLAAGNVRGALAVRQPGGFRPEPADVANLGVAGE